MPDTELIELFEEAKLYLLEIIEPSLNVYLHQDLNPLTSFTLMRETKKLLYQDLALRIPDLPEEYFPKLLFTIDNEAKMFEFNMQNYLNKIPTLEFLGACEYDGVVYDMYLSPRWELEPWVLSRYGHEEKSCLSGSVTAKTEYYLGVMTPLAVAYSMAIDLGHIKE